MKISIGTAVEHDQAVPIRAVQTMPPAWVVDAFTAAVERTRVAVAANAETVESVQIAVAEALMWIDALRQTTRNAGRGRELAELLARDPLIKALGFVRGRVHHHWATVASRYDGVNWGWLSADNLPLPSNDRFADAAGEQLYREHLEHRPVIESLEEVARRLNAVERP